jgi:hypothetical protein
MARFAKLQILGPAVVLITVGVAEVAAYSLARIPTSETLWYVNLRIFGVFQQGYYLLNSHLELPYSQLLLIALPIFAIGAYGFFINRPFPLAFASHLSFIYAGFLFYCLLDGQTHPSTASIASFAVISHPNTYLPLFLAGASLISLLICHFQYLKELLNANSKIMSRADNR